jgi:O-antigen ligase/tetratricopeptide (TPR) repeat protein
LPPIDVTRSIRRTGLPLAAIGAGFFFLCAIHNAVTSFRVDRGWSDTIPAYGLAALAGLVLATVAGTVRRRPLADASTIATIVCGMMVFAYYGGKVPLVPSIEQMAMPPNLRYWYIGATFIFSALIAWIMPVKPVAGFLFASMAFATPATRVLLRWAPEGFEIAPVGLALGAAALARMRDDRPFGWTRLATPAALFVASVFLSALFSSSQQVGWPAFGRTALQCVAFIACVEWFRNEPGGARSWVAVAAWIATAVAASEVWAYYQFVGVVGWGNARLVRLESFAIHPNLSAPFSMAGVAICTGALACSRSWAGRLASLAGIAICAVSLYLHKSGGATMGAAAGAATVVVLWGATGRVRSKKAAGAMAALPLVAAPAVLFVAALVLPSFIPKLKGGGESGKINIATRVEFWPAARQNLLSNPLFGSGPRNVEAHAQFVEEQVEANIDWSNHPHNLLLEVGETLGFTGILALFLLLGAAGLAARRTILNPESGDAPLSIAGVGLIVAILADGFVDHGFAEFAVIPDALWWGLGWIAIALPREPAAAPSRWLAPCITFAAGLALVTGALLPLACSELEQSIKWIHLWIANAGKYDTFRDVPGRQGHTELLLTLAPARSDIRLSYADYLVSRDPAKNIPRANAEVERAVQSSPYTADILLRAGTYCANTILLEPEAQTKRALEPFQRAAKLGNPGERAQAHLGIARCLATQGRMDEALDELGIALSMNPSFPITTFGFRPVADSPEGGRDVMYWLGGNNKLYVSAALRRAVEKYKSRLATDFDAVWGPLARLAECYCNISKPDIAIAIYRDVEEKAPSLRMNLPSAMAQAKIIARDFEGALVDIDRAIKNKEWHPFMSALRAKALEGLDRRNDALEESQRFYVFPMDVVSLRSQGRDALARLATSKQNAAQYRQSADLFHLASIYEDSLIEKIKLEIAACTACIRGYRQSQNKGFLELSQNYYLEACDLTGMMDWSEIDRLKLMELGRDLGNAAGEHARLVFDRLLDSVRDRVHPSAGAYFLTLGVGNIAVDVARIRKMPDFNDVARRVSEVRRVGFSLSARIAGQGL